MKQANQQRYRAPSRWLSIILMLLLSVGIVFLAGIWYTAARQEQLTAQEVPVPMDGTQELPVSKEQATTYGVESAARTTDAKGETAGYLLITATSGYKSRIRVQTVFAADKQRVSTVRVLFQQETEYLGSRITGEDFLSQFKGRVAPLRLWTTPGQGSPVDALSGSTISSKAVVDAVNNAYRYLAEIGDP